LIENVALDLIVRLITSEHINSNLRLPSRKVLRFCPQSQIVAIRVRI